MESMEPPVLVPKPLSAAARKQIVDEFGECDRKLRLWAPQRNPHQARHDELEAEILSWSKDDAADQSQIICGKVYQVEVSARGFKRTFTAAAQAKAFELLKKVQGLDLMQFFSITLAGAKAHLGNAFLEENVPSLQTGPRTVGVVPRAQAGANTRKVA